MTLKVFFGRRVPKSWFRRGADKIKGLITFQENMWQMIKHSMNLAKRKANASGKIEFITMVDRENEDMNYDIEWYKVFIRGTKEQEEEEYKEALQIYSSLGKLMKKEMPTDDRLKKTFKTKVLNLEQLQKIYKKGLSNAEDNNIANKLLEMGILINIELIKDYNGREIDIKPDF